MGLLAVLAPVDALGLPTGPRFGFPAFTYGHLTSVGDTCLNPPVLLKYTRVLPLPTACTRDVDALPLPTTGTQFGCVKSDDGSVPVCRTPAVQLAITCLKLMTARMEITQDV